MEKEIELIRNAAEQGDALVQCALGSWYEQSNDLVKAYFWYKKSAEQGNVDAQCTLGVRAFHGKKGFPQDYEIAVEWFTKAASQGDAFAQCYLGYCYINGNGVNQNFELGLELLTKSAEQGEATALGLLRQLYQAGITFDRFPEIQRLLGIY